VNGDGTATIYAITSTISGNGDQGALQLRSLDRTLDMSMAVETLITRLASLFGVAALMLACMGLYSVMAYSVTRRTSEIGIRMALGATQRDILKNVLREAILLVLAGAAIGVPAALAATRLVSALLFGLKATDPVAISSVVLLMVMVALCAGWVPARRAARVDPLAAVRHE
jgi:ABC-type antimicrobial peptide transport system permease subunit